MLLEGNVLPQLEKNSAIKRLNLMNRFLPSGTRFLESFRIRTVGKPWNREQKRPPVREQTRALRYRSYNYEMFSTNRATEKNERSTGENVGYSRFPSSKWQKIIFLQRLLALRRWSIPQRYENCVPSDDFLPLPFANDVQYRAKTRRIWTKKCRNEDNFLPVFLTTRKIFGARTWTIASSKS